MRIDDIGTASQPGDLTERCLGGGVVTFLEHEARHFQKAEFACRNTERVDILLHRIADEHDGTHARRNSFAPCIRQHAAKLCLPAPAVDLAHESGRM